MYACENNPWWYGGNYNPAYKFLTGCGYDRYCNISTAQLAPSPYTTQALLVAKIGGLNRLIEAVDDSQPPIGSLNPTSPPNNPAYICYNNVLQNVTTEINGYLSAIYPIPLAQTGTIAIFAVSSLSTDGNNSITAVDIIQGGSYLTAPNTNQFPVYLDYIDPRNECRIWANINGDTSDLPFIGSGANFTMTYATQNVSDESGQVITTSTVTAAPTIVSGGTNYQLGELIILTGGASIVPALIRQAMLDITFYELYKRRFAPDEKNPGTAMAMFWRKKLLDISNGEEVLDGTFKRSFTAAMSWNTESVLNGANSL